MIKNIGRVTGDIGTMPRTGGSNSAGSVQKNESNIPAAQVKDVGIQKIRDFQMDGTIYGKSIHLNFMPTLENEMSVNGDLAATVTIDNLTQRINGETVEVYGNLFDARTMQSSPVYLNIAKNEGGGICQAGSVGNPPVNINFLDYKRINGSGEVERLISGMAGFNMFQITYTGKPDNRGEYHVNIGGMGSVKLSEPQDIDFSEIYNLVPFLSYDLN